MSNAPPDSCVVVVLGSHCFLGGILSCMESVGRKEDLVKDERRSNREQTFQPWKEDPLRYVCRVIVGLELDMTLSLRDK